MQGDCLEKMKDIPDCSVDAVITDPPYGLSFMGKKWDYDVPNIEIWRECLRVLKPGGHLLSFAGTRTQHRMAVNIEDAGFEIRDMIAWVYGCLSEDTEILTINGWEKYNKIKIGDSIFACDYKHNLELVVEKIEEMFLYEYNEDAYYIKDTGYYSDNLLKTDHIVSKNHNVLVSDSWAVGAYGIDKIQAEDLYKIVQDRKKKEIDSTFHIPGLRGSIPCLIEKKHYKGKVWCVQVPSGAFVARRNGKIFITGNSGFPKSHNIGKAVDKMGGVCPNWKPLKYEDAVKKSPYTHNDIDKHLGLKASSCYWSRTDDRACIPLEKYWVKIKEFLQLPDDFSAIKPEAEREVIGKSKKPIGHSFAGDRYTDKQGSKDVDITAPATEEAKKWEGWGTATKPAWESITVAQKPVDLFGNFAIMKENLTSLISLCLQNVKTVGKNLKHSQADSKEEKINIAQENVEIQQGGLREKKTQTGRGEDINSKADISELTQEEANIALNTALSWKNILEDVSKREKMSTISTELETIIDWKILNYCLSQATPELIVEGSKNPNGLNSDAQYAINYLNASFVSLKNILTLSALVPVISEQSKETGIKPSLSPIIMSRKPFKGTVANNVLKWGTGGINIDGCRVGLNGEKQPTGSGNGQIKGEENVYGHFKGNGGNKGNPQGRFPANLIHDGSDEVVDLFPETKSSAGKKQTPSKGTNAFGDYEGTDKIVGHTDSGSAARFFYCAKASKKDRNEGCAGLEKGNNHATVKPTKLMQYLVRLVTPKNGICLDPFMGSGSTGKACVVEGFNFIGIEMNDEYFKIAEKRINCRLKCSTAAAALRKLRRLLVRQRISNSTYRLYREAVDRIDYMLQKGMHCAVVEHDLGDWIALGNGGYRRKIHTSTIVLRPFLN